MMNWHVNRLNAVDRVATQAQNRFIHRKFFPNIPLRLNRINRKILHHRRKRFIQPEVVPPFHRHQIAKPLMRRFVRDHQSDVFFRRNRRFFASEHRRFSISYQSPVFHRAAAKIWQCHMVTFFEREFFVKIIFIKFQNAHRNIERKIQKFGTLRLGRPSRNFDARFGFGGFFLEVTNRKCQQISAHFWSFGEFFGGEFAIVTSLDRFRVRNNLKISVSFKFKLKSRLSLWLIDTRKNFARVVAFELRREKFLFFAIFVVITGVKSVHRVGDFARKFNFERDVFVSFERFFAGKNHQFVLFSILELQTFARKNHLRNRQILRMKRNLTRFFSSPQNLNFTRKIPIFSTAQIKKNLVVFWLKCFKKSLHAHKIFSLNSCKIRPISARSSAFSKSHCA